MKTKLYLLALAYFLLLSCGRNYPDLGVSPIADRLYEHLFQLKINGIPVANAKVVQYQKLDKNFQIIDSQDSLLVSALSGYQFDTLVCNLSEFSESNSNYESLVFSSIDTFFNVGPNIEVRHKINDFFKKEITSSNTEIDLLALSNHSTNNFAGNYQGKLVSFGESDNLQDDIRNVNGVVTIDGTTKLYISGEFPFKKIVATINNPNLLNGSLIDNEGQTYSQINLVDPNSISLVNDSLSITFKQVNQVNGDSLVKYVLNLKKL